MTRPRKMAALGLTLLSSVLLASTEVATPVTPWPPSHDISLAVEAGSALDFSSFNRLSPITEAHRLTITSDGRLTSSANEGKAQRHLVAALGFGVATGSFPDKPVLRQYVEQVVRRGYNMVRLDFIEDMLMHQREKDFDFNPTQLDRFHYLVSLLKDAGVYVILNIVTSNNGAYGGIDERWRSRKSLLERLYHDPSAQSHWKELVDRLYLAKNPYTGLSLLHDPVLAGVALANESSLVFVQRQKLAPALQDDFRQWLSQRGVQTRADEDLYARKFDLQEYAYARETEAAAWMSSYLREKGYRGLITAYNNWLSPAESLARSHLQWVDMHNYRGEPDNWVNPGSRLKDASRSLIADNARYIHELAGTRHWGKPFTVSEYGQVFWDQYRRESTLMAPAYAALQGWDAICQHSNAIELKYWQPSSFKSGLHPFFVGMDPINRATEVIAALLYRRGDVRSSTGKVELGFSEDFALRKMPPLSALRQTATQLALVTGVGLTPLRQGARTSPPKSGVVQIDAGNLSRIPLLFDGTEAGELMDMVKRAKLLPPGNRTDVGKKLFESDTGELLLDGSSRTFRVQTERTEAIAFAEAGSYTLPTLSIRNSTEAATTALAAIDSEPLPRSKRMLLVVATDARNTNMSFRDSKEETLEKLGDLPVRIKPVSMTVEIRTPAKDWAVYPLAQSGKRRDAIAIQLVNKKLTFDIDTSNLPQGPALYFEITSTQP